MTTKPSAHRHLPLGQATSIHYTITGEASSRRTVVFIHGWACRRSDFDPLIEHLPSDLRTVTVDLAEHGDSRSQRCDPSAWTMAALAEDVARVLEAEDIPSATVVGHSLGGAVALELARLYPDVVESVIGLDSFHFLGLYPQAAEEVIAPMIQSFRDDFATAAGGLVSMGSVPGTDPAFSAQIFAKMSTARPSVVQVLEEMLRWDMDAVLAQVHQPVSTLAVRALLDPEAVTRYGERITIIPVELGSHHFLLERPQESAQRLVELVQGVPVR